MAQTLDTNGNVITGGFSTNMTPSQYSAQYAGSNAPMPQVLPKAGYSSLTTGNNIQGSLAQTPSTPQKDNYTPVALQSAEDVVHQSKVDTANSQEGQRATSLNDYIYSSLGLNGGTSLEGQKAQAQQQLETEQGLNDKLSRVTSLSKRIQGLDFTSEADKQRILASPIGGITSSDLSGREQEIDRNARINRLDLTAQLFAAQGDVDNANAVIKKSIDYKYADQEAKLKNAIQFYDINDKALGRKAQDQKDIAQAKLTDLQNKKVNDTNIQSMLVQASTSAPQAVLDNAKSIAEKGGSVTDVAMALGKYGGDYYKTELLKQQIASEKAQQSKYYADAAKTRSETGNLNVPSGAYLDPKVTENPTFKLAQSLTPVKTAIEAYKNAINTYGTYELANAIGKGEIQSTYGNALAAWKTMAGLGALSGADFALAENAIPEPALFARNATSVSKLDNSLLNASSQINTYAKTLKTAYPRSAAGIDSVINPVNMSVPKDNLFSKALGQSSTPIIGTAIINKVNNDGTIDFVIPN